MARLIVEETVWRNCFQSQLLCWRPETSCSPEVRKFIGTWL